MTQKRIVVLTLSQNQPLLMISGFKDGELHIIETEHLVSDMRTLKESLPKRLTKYANAGFIVLVDEVIPFFNRFGRAVRLQDFGSDGVAIIVSSIRSYRNLTNYNAISYPDGVAGLYDIPESIIEETRDDKGQINYRIDWSEIRPESCALLLSVHAALSNSLYDAPTAKALFAELNKYEAQTSQPTNRFNNLMAKITGNILNGDM